MERVGDMNNPKIASMYADVPKDRLDDFLTFRRDFPYNEIIFNKVSWPYLVGGKSDTPLLLLSGALAIPDISWTSISNFATQWRVIVPAYPPVKDMDSLVEGIAAVLKHEGIEQVHVMGGSYGGFVAQVFVRKFPQLTRSLVLSHTLAPYPETATRLRPITRLLAWMPMGMLRLFMRRSFRSMMPEWSEETACLLAIFKELVDYTLDKQDVMGILERTLDYSKRNFQAQDLEGWTGKVLLVFGEEDPATPLEVRQRLESLYPGCRVHLFRSAGHATSVTHQEAYQAVINDFLSRS